MLGESRERRRRKSIRIIDDSLAKVAPAGDYVYHWSSRNPRPPRLLLLSGIPYTTTSTCRLEGASYFEVINAEVFSQISPSFSGLSSFFRTVVLLAKRGGHRLERRHGGVSRLRHEVPEDRNQAQVKRREWGMTSGCGGFQHPIRIGTE